MSIIAPSQRPTTIVLMPKNRGLAGQAARALDARGLTEPTQTCLVRGEDVMFLANELARRGRSVLALTGDDLLDEWLARGNTLDGRLERKHIPWNDPAAIYGKPALCLIGPEGRAIRSSDAISIAVCARYETLANGYLRSLEAMGTCVQRALIQGALESVVLHGLADFMIDIVVTGRTVASASLQVYDVIYKSDLAMLETP